MTTKGAHNQNRIRTHNCNTKITKDANKPSKIQHTRDQGQQKRDRQTEPTQQTPDGRQMRDEEGQDHGIGHATQGKTTKTDGNHKGRDVGNITGSNIKHNNANIITRIITNHVKRNVTITNEKNQQAQKSGQKHTRHQHAHATNRTSLASSGIGFIQKYQAVPEISIAVGPQDKTSDDNTHGKKQEREKIHLEETINNTAWDNQLNGWVTRTRNGRHGIRNRKSDDEQLFTRFLGTLETAFSPALDTDAHRKESTNFHSIGKIDLSKTKQDSYTRHKTGKDKERNKCRREKKKEDFERVR
jgi:hypothetical protein